MNKLLRNLLNDELIFFKAIPAIVWQVLFLYAPLSFILAVSFMHKGTLSFANYQGMLAFPYIIIILRSFLLAFVTAIICLFCAYPIAYFIAIKKRLTKTFYLFFLIIPFFTNFLVLTYAWFFVLARDGLINQFLLYLGLIKQPLSLLNTIFATVLVMVYTYLPFMIMPIFSSLERLDMSLIEASLDLGATMRQTFFRVILPSSYSGIKAGFFLVFVPAFSEFVIPLIIGGDNYMFAGTLISYYFFLGQDPYTGSAFTIVASIWLLAVLALLFMSTKIKIQRKKYS